MTNLRGTSASSTGDDYDTARVTAPDLYLEFGLRVSRHEVEAGHFDSSFYGTVSFARHVGVQGGYRSLAIDQHYGEDRYALKVKGPYAGAVVRF